MSALLRWFEPRRGSYPWRRDPDPYRVLASEVMLQQTQAGRVAPAFERFVERYPTVRALAAAPRADVVRQWGSLGYNRRAVALWEAARAIVAEHGGVVPCDPADLRRLPGVGPYTAAAVASLGYGLPVPALDTNVRRVVTRSRLGVDEASSAEVRAAASKWLDRRDPGGWNQALMDLGREVCRPAPRCPECPLARACRFRRSGRSPSRAPRKQHRFEGSFRQVRGAVVRVLREEGPLSLLALATAVGLPRVPDAVKALEGDGLVRAHDGTVELA